jgi:hydrogenase nickel incorporation protein HypA/HybF
MHEFSLIADLVHKVERLAREHDAEKVVAVTVRLGALAHVSPDHFREHWREAVKGTSAEGAQLDLELAENVDDSHARDILLKHVDVV